MLYESGRLLDVWCKDWSDTLADVPEWYPQLVPDHVVAYLDPPYIEKSFKLYQRSFSTRRPYTNAPAGDLHWAAGSSTHVSPNIFEARVPRP